MEGFAVGKGEESYYAIPYSNKGYIIIHKGQQLERLCRTEETARKYIASCKKGKSISQLPID